MERYKRGKVQRRYTRPRRLFWTSNRAPTLTLSPTTSLTTIEVDYNTSLSDLSLVYEDMILPWRQHPYSQCVGSMGVLVGESGEAVVPWWG